jgi:hypothetical protein
MIGRGLLCVFALCLAILFLGGCGQGVTVQAKGQTVVGVGVGRR